MASVGTMTSVTESGMQLVSPSVSRIRRAVASRVEIREWYVCTRGSEPVGPVSTELVARGIIAGKVPREALVARVGDSIWQRAMRVPEITTALELYALQEVAPVSGMHGIMPLASAIDLDSAVDLTNEAQEAS